MKVYLLTEEQKELLIGVKYDIDCHFNPIQDEDGNWIITNEEVERCCADDNFLWVKDLKQIEYKPKETILELKGE